MNRLYVISATAKMVFGQQQPETMNQESLRMQYISLLLYSPWETEKTSVFHGLCYSCTKKDAYFVLYAQLFVLVLILINCSLFRYTN